MSLHRFFRSLQHAFAGVAYAIREERNFHIELAFAIGVVFIAWYFPLSSEERAILILSIVLVLGLELVNTSFERMLDMMKPRVHPYVRVIKDLVAGSVLISAVGAMTIGALIFLPYIT